MSEPETLRALQRSAISNRDGRWKAEADVHMLRAALALALAGLPDPMHPQIPTWAVDGLVAAQIVMNDALGHDDPGDVEAARAALEALQSREVCA